MWRMLQQETPEDFVLSTGVTYTIRQIVEIACEILGISIRWEGEGVNETAIDLKTGNVIVKVDPKYFRPSEVDLLIGSSDKAKNILGWKPNLSLSDIIAEMIDHQMEK
jgi:GDPmannose 4,6-dehydratase